MEKLYEFLDGELTPDVDEQIRAHLAECRGCFPHFEYERVFLRFMEKRVAIEKAPPSLRRKILAALIERRGRSLRGVMLPAEGGRSHRPRTG